MLWAEKYRPKLLKDIINQDEINNVYKEAFILFKPRDKVSGDFYWFAQMGDKFVTGKAISINSFGELLIRDNDKDLSINSGEIISFL